MSLYRSQEMGYYNLIVPHESAWEVLNQLGDLDCLHFVDYDPTIPQINRPFANYIKRQKQNKPPFFIISRCEDSLQKINFIEQQMKKYKRPITYSDNLKELLDNFNLHIRQSQMRGHKYYEEIEATVETKYNFLNEQQNKLIDLQDRHNKDIENRAVLIKGNEILGQQFFQPKEIGSAQDFDMYGKDVNEIRELSGIIKFNQILGVINKEDNQRFQRIVFRITKGNVWINVVDIEIENLLGPDSQLKCIFVIVYPGGTEYNNVKTKLDKVIDSFNATKYEFPSNQQLYQTRLNDIDSQLLEARNLISLTKKSMEQYLNSLSEVEANCSKIQEYKLYVVKEKCLYYNLNLMKMQGSIFCGKVWMPSGNEALIEKTLRSVYELQQLPAGQFQPTKPESNKSPPTYFKLNLFTTPFQQIVDTYGVPRYREINPALFTIVTFPFLFAVMFGDVGHGFLLLLLGIYLTSFTSSAEQTVFKHLLPVRYAILLMGCFAFYIGWIYNDFLSIPLAVFGGSCYNLEGDAWVKTEGCTYPFGLDPVWTVSTNQLAFVNSYKMKLAVILGVTHILFGIVLKGVNAVFFKSQVDFFFEFIPQLIFMLSIFGYMDFMIIFKWLNVYEGGQAPSIINNMINIFLSPTSIPDPPLWGDGTSQRIVNIICISLAIICIPWMLVIKPLILKSEMEKIHKKDNSDIVRQNDGYVQLENVEEEEKKEEEKEEQYETPIQQGNVQGQEEDIKEKDTDKFQEDLLEEMQKKSQDEQQEHKKGQEHDFSEIFVHQVIETIEFVLGSISNTASYLRLWALSLAHSQLAEVFFEMTLAGGIEKGGASGIIGVIVGFPVFALATFGVLMVMDLMECFLHALRLHWVEFQNKFFKADGYVFSPFCYVDRMMEVNYDENG